MLQPLPRGFTLIELLVVITIIVVLLALLVPALDRAIYQAELVACAAQQRSIGMSTVQYTHEYQRRYPWREAVHHPEGLDSTDWRTNQLYKPNVPYDDRAVLKTYLPLKMLNDPLAGEVDLDIEQTDVDSFVFSSYSLWFGFKYMNERGLIRLGDRLHYTNRQTNRTNRFRVLVSDHDAISQGDPFAQGSHPDHEGKLVNHVLQNYAVMGANVGGESAGLKYTWATWGDTGFWERGPVDRTFTYDDLAVETIKEVIVVTDPRLVRVPMNIAWGDDPWRPSEYLPSE